MTITAIETEYAGCRFRSRLEARWAVFLDKLGVRWEYEPQGFELPSGARYLPDFHLPDLDLWVEVKGSEQEFVSDGARYAEAARHLPGVGLMVLGPMPDLRRGMPQHFILATDTHCCGQRVLCVHVAWAEMLGHDAVGVREVGWPCTELTSHRVELPALRGYLGGQARWTGPNAVGWPMPSGVVEAYWAARSARFEHGESGAPDRV